MVEDTSPSRTNTLPLPQQQWMALADSYIQADTMPAISDSEEGEDGSGGTSSNVSDISIHNNDTRSVSQSVCVCVCVCTAYCPHCLATWCGWLV